MTKAEFIKRWGIREGMHIQFAADSEKARNTTPEDIHALFSVGLRSGSIFHQWGDVLEINETDIILLHKSGYNGDEDCVQIYPLDCIIYVRRSVTDDDLEKTKQIKEFAGKMDKMMNGKGEEGEK